MAVDGNYSGNGYQDYRIITEIVYCKRWPTQEIQIVVFQFQNPRYFSWYNNRAFDPSEITFRSQTGFWFNGNAAFVVPIRTGVQYTMNEQDFRIPAYFFSSGYSSGHGYLSEHGNVFSADGFTNDVLKVLINEPDGLPVQPAASPDQHFRTSGPWCFEWQYVHPDKVVVPYSQTIEGLVEPLGDPFGYHWTVSDGDLENEDTATPTFDTSSMSLPSTMTTVDLELRAVADVNTALKTNRTLEVYRDHLERDRENFPVGTDCGHPSFMEYWWTFSRYGETWYCNKQSWNCFGSVWHAYDGSGNGYSTTVPGFSVVATDDEPIDWPTVLSGVQRGDFISYWKYDSGSGTEVMEHAATFTDSSTTFGANNFPTWGYNLPRNDSHGHGNTNWWGTSWEWWSCSPQAYYNNVNSDYQGLFPGEWLVNRVKIHRRP